MKYRAIIFDLYGPLVPNLPTTAYEKSLAQMAAALRVEVGTFRRLWAEARTEKSDAPPTMAIEASLRHVCHAAGVLPSDEQLRAVAEERWTLLRQTHEPRKHVIDTLTRLKARGLRIGLLTDCSVEVPHLWKRTEMARHVDAAIFSCSEGCSKPDPRLYQAAIDGLQVDPKHCLYVGDGEKHELKGALQAGMDAMLFCPAEERELIMARHEPRAWTGPLAQTMLSVLWATEDEPTVTWHVAQPTSMKRIPQIATAPWRERAAQDTTVSTAPPVAACA